MHTSQIAGSGDARRSRQTNLCARPCIAAVQASREGHHSWSRVLGGGWWNVEYLPISPEQEGGGRGSKASGHVCIGRVIRGASKSVPRCYDVHRVRLRLAPRRRRGRGVQLSKYMQVLGPPLRAHTQAKDGWSSDPASTRQGRARHSTYLPRGAASPCQHTTTCK